MLRSIASLLLFGTISPMSAPSSPEGPVSLEVAPPPLISILALRDELTASGAIVVDALSGQPLYERAADEPRAIGSLVKVMTVIVALERFDPHEVVTVPSGVLGIGGTTAGLRPGERYTVQDLVGAAIVGSANDAAYSLAAHRGDPDTFVESMNARARALGLVRTRFEKPAGFDSPGQSSTPRELAWLTMYAWKNPAIRDLAARRSSLLRERGSGREITLVTTNQLLASHPAEVLGLKTGTTELAGQCLISLALAGGRPYIVVVLKSADRYRDTLSLLRSLSRRNA